MDNHTISNGERWNLHASDAGPSSPSLRRVSQTGVMWRSDGLGPFWPLGVPDRLRYWFTVPQARRWQWVGNRVEAFAWRALRRLPSDAAGISARTVLAYRGWLELGGEATLPSKLESDVEGYVRYRLEGHTHRAALDHVRHSAGWLKGVYDYEHRGER